MKNDARKIQLTIVCDCDLNQALENIKQVMPALNFIQPDIRLVYTDYGWRIEIQEDKNRLAGLRG